MPLLHFFRQKFYPALVFCAIASPAISRAVAETLAPPQVLVLPWHDRALLPEVRVKSRRVLRQSITDLARVALRESSTLRAYLEGRGGKVPLLNMRALSEDIVVGAARTEQTLPLSYVPMMCSAGDRYFMALSVVDTAQSVLLASAHTSFAKAEWNRGVGSNNLASVVRAPWTALVARVQERLAAQTVVGGNDALQVGISVGYNDTRHDHGSSYCLNLLVGEKLALAGYKVFLPLGMESLQSIARIVSWPLKIRRPTRQFVFSWLLPPEQQRRRLTLPATYQLRVAKVEAVFGDAVAEDENGAQGNAVAETAVRFALDERTRELKFELPMTVMKFLSQEKQALSLDFLPQIAKIYGAWVYLDKGRAWGLKMNDRLATTDHQIQGHVIGFYGTEKNLKSPQGYQIHEGAIVYVRKGQKAVRVGQNLTFDTTSYPTPWPPP